MKILAGLPQSLLVDSDGGRQREAAFRGIPSSLQASAHTDGQSRMKLSIDGVILDFSKSNSIPQALIEHLPHPKPVQGSSQALWGGSGRLPEPCILGQCQSRNQEKGWRAGLGANPGLRVLQHSGDHLDRFPPVTDLG